MIRKALARNNQGLNQGSPQRKEARENNVQRGCQIWRVQWWLASSLKCSVVPIDYLHTYTDNLLNRALPELAQWSFLQLSLKVRWFVSFCLESFIAGLHGMTPQFSVQITLFVTIWSQDDWIFFQSHFINPLLYWKVFPTGDFCS